jgi:N-acetylmuramoyl-L-alanine amidase/Mannosyl-glycoprotein endo-beta-N-acetylglucosaminidase
MAQATQQFRDLVRLYNTTDIEFDGLRNVTVAQWMLESGYGQSQLARQHYNFGGLKWRSEMTGFATPVEYQASDGPDSYCKFDSLAKFIGGYWRFIDRAPYNGWRNHADSSEDFIRYIGPIYTPTHLYAETVLNLVPLAMALAAEVTGNVPVGPPPGTSEPFPKPAIKQFIQSPNYNGRNGAQIRRVVLHYTTSRNVEGTISHFLSPSTRVSAHYVIAQNGDIYQMVRDSESAWHARSANAESIGIEHSAAPGDEFTPPQEASSIALLRWLVSTYKLRWDQVDGHRFTPGNIGATDCPDHLFGDASEDALRNWIETKAKPA